MTSTSRAVGPAEEDDCKSSIPGVTPLLDETWLDEIWADAVADAAGETGLSAFPDDCPWRLTDVLEVDWLPE
ncbi:DUF29 family protein [Thiocapsa rosea]|uniref:DUF29 family protein n=1 Tax=Thiocapsa rosea TaxID=69360 RepID=UPI001FEA774B|nr:DUF29 family protein [Thiocapsa rosea]